MSCLLTWAAYWHIPSNAQLQWWGIATLILIGYSVLSSLPYGCLHSLLGILFLTHSDMPSSVVNHIKCDQLGRNGIPSSLTTQNWAPVMTTYYGSIELHGTDLCCCWIPIPCVYSTHLSSTFGMPSLVLWQLLVSTTLNVIDCDQPQISPMHIVVDWVACWQSHCLTRYHSTPVVSTFYHICCATERYLTGYPPQAVPLVSGLIKFALFILPIILGTLLVHF